jgi:hypothetical protein
VALVLPAVFSWDHGLRTANRWMIDGRDVGNSIQRLFEVVGNRDGSVVIRSLFLSLDLNS